MVLYYAHAFKKSEGDIAIAILLTRAFVVCIHKVWIYRCRPELIWLARLHQHEQLLDLRYLLICDKYRISRAGQIFI